MSYLRRCSGSQTTRSSADSVQSRRNLSGEPLYKTAPDLSSNPSPQTRTQLNQRGKRQEGQRTTSGRKKPRSDASDLRGRSLIKRQPSTGAKPALLNWGLKTLNPKCASKLPVRRIETQRQSADGTKMICLQEASPRSFNTQRQRGAKRNHLRTRGSPRKLMILAFCLDLKSCASKGEHRAQSCITGPKKWRATYLEPLVGRELLRVVKRPESKFSPSGTTIRAQKTESSIQEG